MNINDRTYIRWQLFKLRLRHTLVRKYNYRIIRETKWTQKVSYKSRDEYDIIKVWTKKNRRFGRKMLNPNFEHSLCLKYSDEDPDHHTNFTYELQRRVSHNHFAKWKSLGYLTWTC